MSATLYTRAVDAVMPLVRISGGNMEQFSPASRVFPLLDEARLGVDHLLPPQAAALRAVINGACRAAFDLGIKEGEYWARVAQVALDQQQVDLRVSAALRWLAEQYPDLEVPE